MYTSLLFHFRLQTLLPGLSLITCNPSRGFASDGGTNSGFLILLNVRATHAPRHAAVALVTHSHPVLIVREKMKVVTRPTDNRKRERGGGGERETEGGIIVTKILCCLREGIVNEGPRRRLPMASQKETAV